MWKTVFSVVLMAHGIGHCMGFLAAWTSVPMGFTDRPWLFGDAKIDGPVGQIFGVLWLIALVGFIAAGAGLLLDKDWWKLCAVASAVISLVAILPWWNTMPLSPRLGAIAVDVIVLILIPLKDRW